MEKINGNYVQLGNSFIPVPTVEENRNLKESGFLTVKDVYEQAKKEGKENYVIAPFQLGGEGKYDGAYGMQFDDENKIIYVFGK